MKRVYLILTLFITSFFFVSLNKVSADTLERSIDESEFSYINNDFLKLRELVINYSEENNKSYVISMYDDDSGNSYPVAYVFKKTSEFNGTYSAKVGGDDNRVPKLIVSGEYTIYSLSSDFTSLVEIASDSRFTTQLRTDNTSSSKFSMRFYLDTDVKIFKLNVADPTLIIYNNLSYLVGPTNSYLPTLYQIYLDSGFTPKEPDKFENEKELMNNFYSTIFVKISNLATDLTDNYTFLLIFTIFIFIFVIELIRRYLL